MLDTILIDILKIAGTLLVVAIMVGVPFAFGKMFYNDFFKD